MFKGETLRGLLLNAYAFGTMGMIAGIAAIAAFIAAAVMLVLSGLGLMHARRVSRRRDPRQSSRPRPDPGHRVNAGQPGLILGSEQTVVTRLLSAVTTARSES